MNKTEAERMLCNGVHIKRDVKVSNLYRLVRPEITNLKRNDMSSHHVTTTPTPFNDLASEIITRVVHPSREVCSFGLSTFNSPSRAQRKVSTPPR
jgi:hypothetical protein